jgi:hypothetical protein
LLPSKDSGIGIAVEVVFKVVALPKSKISEKEWINLITVCGGARDDSSDYNKPKYRTCKQGTYSAVSQSWFSEKDHLTKRALPPNRVVEPPGPWLSSG